MLLMYACGLRITEAATLEVTAIDGVNGLVRVIGKGNKERQVPLPQPVLTELRRLWKTHGNKRWLCPSPRRNGPISRYALWLTFKQAARAGGFRRTRTGIPIDRGQQSGDRGQRLPSTVPSTRT